MGQSDIGQGVVVAQQRVLAVEAAEGTDNMIRRVAGLRRKGLVGRFFLSWPARGGRTDAWRGDQGCQARPGLSGRPPGEVGPRTVRLASEAGLAGIAIEAGSVLVVSAGDDDRGSPMLPGSISVGVAP